VPEKSIAVIGTGISGLSAAWLLGNTHRVVVYEQDARTGGHSNTVTVESPNGSIPVDTGFIVYNEATYPNLSALFAHLRIPTQPSEMSFAVSLMSGKLEYSGGSLGGLFAQRSNILRPRFWSMLTDLWRFYREAPRDLALLSEGASLQDYLDSGRYGHAFRNDHLLPMASAIWSSCPASMLEYPAASFIRFHDNHGLLKLRNRPQWRTVSGGSRTYVDRLACHLDIRLGCGVVAVRRSNAKVYLQTSDGRSAVYDDVVIATPADQALNLLQDPTEEEKRLLSAFRYSKNQAILHGDPSLMPKRRTAWASWNYLAHDHEATNSLPMVTYWMNSLQHLATDTDLFVTLNPSERPQNVLREEQYDHPIFDAAALAAQKRLWSLQGRKSTWFCGAYFGAGFHEDGLQAGLAVAEQLGGVKRPWQVPNESGRIQLANEECLPANEAA